MSDPWGPPTDEEIDRDIALAAWLRWKRRRRRWIALFTVVSMLLFLAARNAITVLWGT